MTSEFQRKAKRLLDVVLSLAILLAASPLLLVSAILIKLTSRGPVFYRWRIVGKGTREVVSYKLRTMVEDAELTEFQLRRAGVNEMRTVYFKIRKDGRVTSLGKFLRKFSVDEIPSLYSVLKGEVSLVGPRPVRVHEFRNLKSWHKERFTMKPGVTSLWVTKGKNKIDDFDDIVQLDLEYIGNWSLLLDLKILMSTVPVVVFGRNY